MLLYAADYTSLLEGALLTATSSAHLTRRLTPLLMFFSRWRLRFIRIPCRHSSDSSIAASDPWKPPPSSCVCTINTLTHTSLSPSARLSSNVKTEKARKCSHSPQVSRHKAASFAGSRAFGVQVYHFFFPQEVHAQAAHLSETLGSICSF